MYDKIKNEIPQSYYQQNFPNDGQRFVAWYVNLEKESMNYFKKIFFLICCVLPLFLAGCTPIVTIIEPVNGDKFEAGEKIVFKGQATDPLHPNLADDAFVWTSDKDGEIGTGASIESSDLSEGEHTITLTVKDPNGQIGQSSVSITIGNDGVPTTTTTIENTPTTTTTIETTTTTTIAAEPTTTTTIAAEPTTTAATPTTTTTAASGQRFVDNGDGTVTDTRTGLVWLKNANPCGIKPWGDAGTYCASLASGQAGLTDGSTAGQWRLPSVQELEGIGTDPPTTYCLDGSSCNWPSVTWTMPGAPFTNVQSNYYWSGTSGGHYTMTAWYVLVGNGYVVTRITSYGYYVWPVRSGNSTSGQRFVDNGDGTVTDARTNLVWLKNANPCGTKIWYDAGTYCASLANGQAGLTDGSTAGQWRLPSIEELEGIGTDPPTTYCLDNSCNSPSATWTMPDAPFTGVQSYYYWSGTSGGPTHAWFVLVNYGYVYFFGDRSNGLYYVWPVRSGN